MTIHKTGTRDPPPGGSFFLEIERTFEDGDADEEEWWKAVVPRPN